MSCCASSRTCWLLPELELCFRLLLLRALGGLLALCTALPLCAHALGGMLLLRCAAKVTFRVDRSPSVLRPLTRGLAQQPSRVARLLALVCMLLQPLSHRRLTALRHDGIPVPDDVVTQCGGTASQSRYSRSSCSAAAVGCFPLTLRGPSPVSGRS